MDKEKIEYIKMRFPRGTKITLIYMEGEPQMPKGLTGTVEYVDDIGQVHVHWANGSSLALNLDVDKFVKASSECEARAIGSGVVRNNAATSELTLNKTMKLYKTLLLTFVHKRHIIILDIKKGWKFICGEFTLFL